MNAYIDQHREKYGVEQICKVLQVAPSAYRRHAARRRDPVLRSQRARRDDALMPNIQRIWQENYGVYGAKKVWHQLQREGRSVARCTVERLMRIQGLKGVRRGKRVRTTIADDAAERPLDRVKRQFRAARPNQLWVLEPVYVLWTRAVVSKNRVCKAQSAAGLVARRAFATPQTRFLGCNPKGMAQPCGCVQRT